jgi:hypothetical protein
MTQKKKTSRANKRHADAPGDFFYDELMTPQPDATQAFFRARLGAIEDERKAQDRARLDAGNGGGDQKTVTDAGAFLE